MNFFTKFWPGLRAEARIGWRPCRLWKDQTEQMLPGHDGNSNIVYDEAGTLHCYDRTSKPMVRHRMAYIGHESKRKALKYRCPARHEGWSCPHDAVCNAGKSYGKTRLGLIQKALAAAPPGG